MTRKRKRERTEKALIEKIDNLQEQLRLQHLLIVSLMQTQINAEVKLDKLTTLLTAFSENLNPPEWELQRCDKSITDTALPR